MEAQTRVGAARVAGVQLGVQPGQVLNSLEGQQRWRPGFSGLRHTWKVGGEACGGHRSLRGRKQMDMGSGGWGSKGGAWV